MAEIKPLFRGQLHRVAFWIYLPLSFTLLVMARSGVPRLSLAIYLITLINLYGVSSILHITNWQTAALDAQVQQIDHANIFLLIAGTYTPLCLNAIPATESWALFMLLAVWIVALAGIIKCLCWRNLPKWFEVSFYFFCGLVAVPFLPGAIRSSQLHGIPLILVITGGAIYLMGGIVYGVEYPDPWPLVFGHHEIFHLFTVIANFCFLACMCMFIIS